MRSIRAYVCREVVDKTVQAFGHIDILVNNASMQASAPAAPFVYLRQKRGCGAFYIMYLLLVCASA